MDSLKEKQHLYCEDTVLHFKNLGGQITLRAKADIFDLEFLGQKYVVVMRASEYAPSISTLGRVVGYAHREASLQDDEKLICMFQTAPADRDIEIVEKGLDVEIWTKYTFFNRFFDKVPSKVKLFYHLFG